MLPNNYSNYHLLGGWMQWLSLAIRNPMTSVWTAPLSSVIANAPPIADVVVWILCVPDSAGRWPSALRGMCHGIRFTSSPVTKSQSRLPCRPTGRTSVCSRRNRWTARTSRRPSVRCASIAPAARRSASTAPSSPRMCASMRWEPPPTGYVRNTLKPIRSRWMRTLTSVAAWMANRCRPVWRQRENRCRRSCRNTMETFWSEIWRTRPRFRRGRPLMMRTPLRFAGNSKTWVVASYGDHAKRCTCEDLLCVISDWISCWELWLWTTLSAQVHPQRIVPRDGATVEGRRNCQRMAGLLQIVVNVGWFWICTIRAIRKRERNHGIYWDTSGKGKKPSCCVLKLAIYCRKMNRYFIQSMCHC